MPSQRDRRFFSATSLERAVLEAAGYYEVRPEELAFEKVEKRTGFTKRRKVVIRVDPDRPTRVPDDGPEPDPGEARPPARRAEQGAEEAKEPAKPALEEPGVPVGYEDGEEVETEAAAEEAVVPGEGAPPERPSAGEEAAAHEAFLAPQEPVVEIEAEAEIEAEIEPEEETEEPELAAAEPVEPAADVAETAEAPAVADAAAPAATDRQEAEGEEADGTTARGQMNELPASSESLREEASRVPDEVEESARARLEDLLRLAGLRLQADVFAGEEGLELELHGEDSDLVAEEEGQVIRAFEHLMPRLMQSDLGRILPCRVDCENFQALREERLRSRAQQAAEEVRRRGQSKTLEPMHPADRRIVHLTLVPDASVTTESVGRGYFRRVSVRPV